MAESASPQRPSRDKASSAVTPYGLWPSPIDGEQVAGQATAYDAVHTSGEAVYWLETRPSQDGRAVVVRWTEATGAADAVPAGFDVGSRVHEYGGGAYFPAGTVLFACSQGDQRLYRVDQDLGASPDHSRAADSRQSALCRPASHVGWTAAGLCAGTQTGRRGGQRAGVAARGS